MKTGSILLGALCMAFAAGSCSRQTPAATEPQTVTETIVFKDYGAERTVLWTGGNLQVTVMAIPVGGDVGLEQHNGIDQFLRVEEGTAQVMMGDSADKLDFVKEVKDDYAIFVPAGKWHNIVNKGDKPLKIYSIYAPAEHPHGTIHKTQQESMEAEHAH